MAARGGEAKSIRVSVDGTIVVEATFSNTKRTYSYGAPGFVLDTFTLMLVPTQTPAEVVERLSGAVRMILQKSDVRDKLRAVGLEVTAGGPAELKARFARELPLWRDIMQISGITPQ